MALFIVLFFVCNDLLMPWYVDKSGILIVPSITGKPFDIAKSTIDSIGLEGRQGDIRMDKSHTAGIVIFQHPPAGEQVKRGRRVYMTVSGGEMLVSVPNLRGRTLRDAKFALEREGLKLGAIEYLPSEDYPINTILEQRMSPGAKVKKDIYVSVTISQGRVAENIIIPDLNGKTLNDALNILRTAGLNLGKVTYLPAMDLLPNTVVDQYPRVGERASPQQAIDLFVVQGGEKKRAFPEN